MLTVTVRTERPEFHARCDLMPQASLECWSAIPAHDVKAPTQALALACFAVCRHGEPLPAPPRAAPRTRA